MNSGAPAQSLWLPFPCSYLHAGGQDSARVMMWAGYSLFYLKIKNSGFIGATLVGELLWYRVACQCVCVFCMGF